jgi:serine-type D-Ala-D-Ala carboxypeptidase (penicillin-binding protein 5/6)
MKASIRLATALLPLLALPLLAAQSDGNPAPAASIVIEATTGRVLAEENAQAALPVASMTKMMTLLITMERVDSGGATLDDAVRISRNASRQGGSQVYLREGDSFTIRQLVAASLIHSANDAAMALAEHFGGDEAGFVKLMNDRARSLGLADSHFYSANGMPSPDHPDDALSARDAAKLASRLVTYPLIRDYASKVELPFENGNFKKLYNTNALLTKFPGATGLKTGSSRTAGFCVTATAQRGDLSIIAVDLGAKTRDASFDSAARLMKKAFDEYRWVEPVKKGVPLKDPAIVKGGEVSTVAVTGGDTVRLLIRKSEARAISVSIESSGVKAPVRKGQQVGLIIVKQNDRPVASVPALSTSDVAETSWWKRLGGM